MRAITVFVLLLLFSSMVFGHYGKHGNKRGPHGYHRRAHHGRDRAVHTREFRARHHDNGDSSSYCRFALNDNEYDLTSLQLTEGPAYGVKDQDGNMIFFNMCGTLSGLDEVSTYGCNPDMAVCIVTPEGKAIGAASTSPYWENFDNGIEWIGSHGDECTSGETDSRNTVLMLTCNPDADFVFTAAVASSHSSKCTTIILAETSLACSTNTDDGNSNGSSGSDDDPSVTSADDDDDGETGSHGRRGHRSGFVFGLLVPICCLAFCIVSCICRRRRRALQNRQMNGMNYQRLPQMSVNQPPQNVPTWIPHPTPVAPPMMNAFQPVYPAFAQVPQVPQYYNLYPPVAPSVDIVARESQITSDESFARKLHNELNGQN